MNLKRSLLLLGALLIIFFTAQSFFGRPEINQAIPSGYSPEMVAFCGPAFEETENVPDISPMPGTGDYNFKISTKSDSAQFYFNQGLRFYYSFHMIEAYASFTKANKLDSTSGMTWFGKALSMGPTINYGNSFKPSNDAVRVAFKSKLFRLNATPVEVALIDAIQVRYSSDTSISVMQLRKDYAKAMKQVYEQFPDNADVVTLYADALMLLHPWDLYDNDSKPKEWTGEIRALLEKAMALSPDHPGANHYYIHTIEASEKPQDAINSAHLLDSLMPSVSHMVHMASHIYLRTGDYKRGVLVNTLAVDGYNTYANIYREVRLGRTLYEVHNNALKAACAQMGGNYRDAVSASIAVKNSVTKDKLQKKGADGDFYQFNHIALIHTWVRFGKWSEILDNKIPANLKLATTFNNFARGMAFCARRDLKQAKKELAKMEAGMLVPHYKKVTDNFTTTYDVLRVGQLILRGTIAAGEQNNELAIKTLTEAVDAEMILSYREPRSWPIPARQFLGNQLLKSGKYAQAIAVFKKDLEIHQNNGWSLTGLKIAYERTNNATALKDIERQLAYAWRIKDVEIEAPVF